MGEGEEGRMRVVGHTQAFPGGMMSRCKMLLEIILYAKNRSSNTWVVEEGCVTWKGVVWVYYDGVGN